ncbi:beta-ketoacyl-[acyl-carrier-protein] synthase family protein [Actinomadura oligospora]|uniref:beta-ketoacyl-[acyl-carrier-protein] synthase family protein n=1 Tax=Actinomadura oligospora TaxID=111804 RepID=UPI0004B55C1A|nr:beta-ketoacyl-[acyl-carrier-protein] synthase family protein [Actinomadura oligospora]
MSAVVVTGLGPVTPIGIGAADFHKGQVTGRNGIRSVTRFAPEELGPCIAGEVDLPDSLALPVRLTAKMDRTVQLAIVATDLAMEDAGLDLEKLDLTRFGISVGTGAGNLESLAAIWRAAWDEGGRRSRGGVPRVMSNAIAAGIAIRHGLSGPVTCSSLACAAGGEALAVGHQMITSGEADIVVAGGAEAPVFPEMISSLRAHHALSARVAAPTAASRPFSPDRDGFVLAEGAGMLILESEEHASARGAAVKARFAGYGRTCDAYNVVAPRPDGSGAGRAIEIAMRRAGLTPDEVSYINAHGTSTPLGDAAEVMAIRTALADRSRRVPVSATKSQTGHSLGASGGIEAIAVVQAIGAGFLPPTLNLERPDPAFDLDFVGPAPRDQDVTAALSHSFGFGGHNVVLAFTRP